MSKPQKVIAEKFIGEKGDESKSYLTERDAILYALGIGFSQDPLRTQDFKFTAELNEDFTPFCTMAVVIPPLSIFDIFSRSPSFPTFDPFGILHGEQKLTMHKTKLIPGSQFVHRAEVIDVEDKGKYALVTVLSRSFVISNGKEEPAFDNELSIIVRGVGGFGYSGAGRRSKIPALPKTNPDKILPANTYPSQAFLYRLSGDWNPLHIDPNIATLQRFDRPILHGLCSLGVTVRTIVQGVLGNNGDSVKSFHCRFTGHVYPGESFLVKLWQVGPNKLLVAVQVKERGTTALVGELVTREQAKL